MNEIAAGLSDLTYIVSVFGLAYIAGQSLISLSLRTALADFRYSTHSRTSHCVSCKATYAFTGLDVNALTSCERCHAASSVVTEETARHYAVALPLIQLIECPACFATWIGVIDAMLSSMSFIEASKHACFTCGGVAIIAYACGLMQSNNRDTEK